VLTALAVDKLISYSTMTSKQFYAHGAFLKFCPSVAYFKNGDDLNLVLYGKHNYQVIQLN